MNTKEAVIHETFQASQAGTIHFGQVIGALAEIGVESYFVDYRTRQVTYYFPSDETFSLVYDSSNDTIGESFSQVNVKSAILEAQRGEVMYPEFKKLSQAAGCVAYFVWIKGRHVSYFGRKGETHIEHFPN
jgi:uncharacterized protein YbcV (DUF1398 family)